MKVLYKNKIGRLIPLNGYHCRNCIYYPEGVSVSHCKKVGLLKLCISALNHYEFIFSSSDVLNL